MDDLVILYKSLICILAFFPGYIILFYIIKNQKIKRIREFLFIIFILTRIVIYFVVFILLGISPQSDVPAFYYPQAKNVLKGLTPYRDYISSYSPLFSYFTAIPLLIWDHTKSIILFSIIIEIFNVFIWYRISKEKLDEWLSNIIIAFYTFNPISLIIVSINGQNQIWLSLFFGITYYLIVKKQIYLAGICFGFGFLVTKFLFLLFLLPIFFLL